MTPASSASAQVAAAKGHLWGSFGKDPSYFDLPGSIIASAEGSTVVDIEGDSFVDSWSCACAATLGYNHPQVVEAMREQMSSIVQNPTGWPASTVQVELAEQIASLTPDPLEYTIFSCNGTDANETAIKIARQYFQLQGKSMKYKVISRDRAYHGVSFATLSAGGMSRRRKYMEPLPTGYAQVGTPYCYRCKYPGSCPDCAMAYAEELRTEIEAQDPATVACFILEQTPVGGGVLPPSAEYLTRVREICDEYDVLLIFDEVITGFGRTGTWFECEQFGVVPDLLTMAKGLTSGHAALSATHARAELAECFFGDPSRVFAHGYTFGGMPVACAAALATIEVIRSTDLLAQIPERSAAIRAGLDEIAERSSLVGDVRHKGMLFAVELVEDRETRANWDDPTRSKIAQLLGAAARDNGVIMQPFNQFGTSFLSIAPPLNVADEDVETIFVALEAALLAVQNGLA